MRKHEVIFVTGGAGFVGRHIVERLIADGYAVRALVRRPPEAPLPPSVEVIIGDFTKPSSYEPALPGAAAVIHSALTEDYSQDAEAAVELRNRAAHAGARKFVHLSTISVYGNPLEGTITEDTPPVPVDDPYARGKLAIEERLREPSGMAEVVVLRLGCVYGPGGGWWTTGLLNLMKQGRLIKVNNGNGTANLIHVADIAATIPVVLDRSNAPFEIFNLTDGMPVSWSRYFSELEKLLGRNATASMDEAEAHAYGRKWLQPTLTGRVLRKLRGAKFIHPLDDRGVAGFVSRAVYSNQRASRLLGFQPAYTLERGMESVRSSFNASWLDRRSGI